MDTTGWTPITDASGKVLGWTAPADVETPHERKLRDHVIGVRADAIDQAADLLMDKSFGVDETWDAAEASGMPAGLIDAAGNVALLLNAIEESAVE
jgi:hypothetical protein